MTNIFKPNKNSFVYYISSKLFLILIILAIITTSLTFNYNPLIGIISIIGALIGSAIFLLYRQVRYSKEEYEFLNNKIIVRGGGFVSDFEREIKIKNITQVKLNLPFFQTKIMKTGNIFVEAAGSSNTVAHLSNLDNSKEYFSIIQELMKKNGFTLSKKNLIQKEKPHIVAVFLEVFQNAIATVIAATFFILTVLIDLINILDTPLTVLLWVLGLVFAGLLTRFVFQFMNLKKKTYYLYEDTAYYEDGFFTENYSYIPIENLSDSELTQNFISRILGLYDLRISSQGGGNEILFYNIKNGKKFEDNLDELINKTKTLVGKEKPSKKETKSIKSNKTTKESSYTSEFKMNMKRVTASFLIWLAGTVIGFLIIITIGSLLLGQERIGYILSGSIFIIGIILISLIAGLVFQIVEAVFTTYKVNRKSFEKNYEFLNTSNIEFSSEKVTSIMTRENPIDKALNTHTIVIYSIGSKQPIEYKHISKEENALKGVIGKFGLKKEKPKHSLKPNYSFVSLLKSNLGYSIISALLIIISFIASYYYIYSLYIPATVLVLYSLIHFYKKEYYKKAELDYYKEHVEFKEGLIVKDHHFVLYENIKDVVSTRYPFSNKGSLNINAAGEIIQDQQNKIPFKVGFTAHYIEGSLRIHDDLDETLHHKNSSEKYDSSMLIQATPSIANPLTKVFVLSVIFFPFILLLPITIPVTIIKTKRKSYSLEGCRAVRTQGVLYRKKKTVLYAKIDHISSGKGLLNKIYNNGNLSIFTTGSSSPELIMYNFSKYKNFYKKLEGLYYKS